ncbi:hypothetical protein C8F04DRAFT_1398455 [Mycena alexandri]|uniref:F-box domain-containing protein n=1 Tax=Mycena alexandri TaxID=1745969 RepID=A0AAD6SMN6_9AGAR|nr:hypothetical protein C8F04DRAFT_1398455 [Mycena alexandri]
MPRGGRARRAKPEESLIPKDSVQLPQELIDGIIDEFDVSLTDVKDTGIFPDRNTLRSCALVCRAFARPSQKKLFSIVSTQSAGWNQPPDERLRLFSKFLASNPHIGQYVRTLNLGYRCARSKSLDYILVSLPNLRTLSLYPWKDLYGRNSDAFEELPIHHRDAFLAAFSLSSLRSLSLRNHLFSNALELQSMLINSVGLEELVLQSIKWADLSVVGSPKGRPHSPRLVLKSLKLVGMSISDIDALLNAFTAVDIRHLQSLCCDRYHHSLFQAASTIRDLSLIADTPNFTIFYPEQRDLISPSSLQSLSLNVDNLAIVLSLINRLGTLKAAPILKRISVSVSYWIVAGFWPLIEPMLLEASSVEDICLKLNPSAGTEAMVRASLPTINAKGILKISFM